MKIIDEKGRLFGKINVIDFMVILFLICLTPMFYFGYKLFKKSVVISEVSKKFIEIDLNCKFIEVEPEILKQITVGNKEIDKKGTTLGEIISLGEIKPYQYEFSLGGGEVLTKEDAILKEISAKLRLRVEMRDNNLYYKDRLIAINSPFDFRTKEYTLQAIIPVAKKEWLKEKWMEVKVRFSGVIPEVAKILSEGDTEKNPLDKTIARLRTIVSNKSSEVLILKENKFLTVSHPFQKDIVAILDFLCIEKEGTLYFKNYPVKMGNSITFTTDLYSLTGSIVSLEIK